MAELSDLDWTSLTLKAHLERSIADLHRHTESIFTEQRRATDMAERERQKAADALAATLARSIQEGDERLREHVSNQIMQVSAALVSAEALECERFASAKSEVEALRRELILIQEGASKAVEVAQEAQEKRNQSFNEFRGQLTDRIQEHRNQLAEQSGTFLPREVADARFEETRKQIDTLTRRVDTTGGERVGERRQHQVTMGTVAALVGVATLVLGIVIALANILTGG